MSEQGQGFWSNLTTGLKVVVSELRWIVAGRVRAFEIMQLRRRLEREYEALGRLAEPQLAALRAGAEADLSGLGRDVDLCLKQIVFLREEITLLDGDRRRSRRRFEEQRARDLGLDKESGPQDK